MAKAEKKYYKFNLESIQDPNVKKFIQQHENEIIENIDVEKIKIKIVQENKDGIEFGAKQILQGNLVAFQTETVYGLGADAMNEQSIKKIFEAKTNFCCKTNVNLTARPLHDPLIIHIAKYEQSLNYINITKEMQQLYEYLANKFWPGPLTIVVKANEKVVPQIVTAGTGYVGIRMPSTRVSQSLIQQCNKPIVAPSANLFGHASPTTEVHVFNDFWDKDITLITSGKCELGIESTVIKIIEEAQTNQFIIEVLRYGSISVPQLQDYLSQHKIYRSSVKIIEKCKTQQQIKHYYVYIDTCILSIFQNSQQLIQQYKVLNPIDLNLSNCALIDFADIAQCLRDKVGWYSNLSTTGNIKEAMNQLYEQLRSAEIKKEIKVILIADTSQMFQSQDQLPEFFEVLYDRIYKSAGGNRLAYSIQEGKFYQVDKKY